MAPADDDKPASESKQTVKDLLSGAQLDQAIDAATQAELMRWFSAPSFTELEEQGEPVPVDPEMEEVRERRQKAIALVDRALLERIDRRYQDAWKLLRFQASIDLKIRTDRVSLLDESIGAAAWRLIDVRVQDYPEELIDQMREVAPQALLRDLHRSEETFEKLWEVTDFGAAQKFDIVAEIAQALRTDLRLPPLAESPYQTARKELAADKATRRGSWLAIPMPNRQVTE